MLLSSYFYSHPIFYDRNRWIAIFQFLSYKFNAERNKSYKKSPKIIKENKLFDTIKKFNKNASIDFADKSNIISISQKNSNKNLNLNNISKSVLSQAIEEISNLMCKLDLKAQESTKTLLAIYNDYNLRNNDMIQLLEIHLKRKSIENLKFFKSKSNKTSYKSKLAFIFKKAVSYLDWKRDDVLNLRLISKFINQKINNSIYFLILNDKKQTNSDKIKIWTQILDLVIFNIKPFINAFLEKL